ncbi:MAG: phosphoribosylformylglycinamidine cyclo-ligase [Dehalococcoidia bacterium]|jgi:phosphoribosylformylglycinamidine cyclo-ligase|nr:phosphoribosylformylglycinamidine cyclo-ligase [Dehalococcoidia bacterium]
MTDRPAGKTYADAGVDLNAAASVKDRIKGIAAATLGSAVVAGPGGFGGVIDPDPSGDTLLVASTDGVGTKLRIADALGRHDTVGASIVNHCINDILPAGARPLFFLDYIGLSRFDPDKIAEIVSGLAKACAEAGCALLGGETATMPDIYHGNDYDLAGFIVGTVRKDALLKPENTRDGDVVLGLASDGLHTNGYSLVRSVFETDDDPSVLATNVPETSHTLGELLLRPHLSYLDTISPVLDKVRGLGHITGGSFDKNIPRALADGLGADIDISTWTVPPLFNFIQETGNVEDQEMFRVFNMGIGMTIIVEPGLADDVLDSVPGAFRIGQVVRRAPGEERTKLIGL